ncbi:MAG: TetR/AcrR family transcriptional regulator [Microbacterium sp.]
MAPPTIEPPEPGLRERKRRATRRAIQVAAIEAVEEHGLTGATIEVICRRADVSPRTFFNHFPAKEAALLGQEWLPLRRDEVDAFVQARGPVLEDLGRLLLTVVNVDGLDRELVRRRIRLAERHAALAGSRVRWIAELESDVREAILARTDAEHPDASASLRARAATLLAAASVSAFRSAWAWWASHGDDASLSADISLAFSLLAAPAETLGSPAGPGDPVVS